MAHPGIPIKHVPYCFQRVISVLISHVTQVQNIITYLFNNQMCLAVFKIRDKDPRLIFLDLKTCQYLRGVICLAFK